MTAYVLGFAFNSQRDFIVMLQKCRPAKFAGLWCPPGGHVDYDLGESPHEAVGREFLEECGTAGSWMRWEYFATITRPNATVFCFRSFGDFIFSVRTMTDEYVEVWPVSSLSRRDVVHDTRWLAALALDEHTRETLINVPQEML